MRFAALVSLVLSGCLYVSTSDDGGAIGEIYECSYRKNLVSRTDRVCSWPGDDDYARLHVPSDPGTVVVCRPTSDPCVLAN